jgi:hypothetical protein
MWQNLYISAAAVFSVLPDEEEQEEWPKIDAGFSRLESRKQQITSSSSKSEHILCQWTKNCPELEYKIILNLLIEFEWICNM